VGLQIPLEEVSPGKMVVLPGGPSGPLYDGPIFPVGGPKLVPLSQNSIGVDHMLDILVGNPPVFRWEKPMGAVVVPLYGALDLGPGERREAIREEPVGEGLSELETLVQGLEAPVVLSKLWGRVIQESNKAGHLKATGSVRSASGRIEQRASPD